jgi:microcystin degradation protein MlrC
MLLQLRVGGKIGPSSGDLLNLDCTVKAPRTEHHMTGLGGSPRSVGDAVWIESAGIDIVLISLRRQATGTDVFTDLGCDHAARRIVVVKSAQQFHASFSKVVTPGLYVSAPGETTTYIQNLDYRKIRRPKWPLAAVG